MKKIFYALFLKNKKHHVRRYSLLFGIAACAVIILSFWAANQKFSDVPSPADNYTQQNTTQALTQQPQESSETNNICIDEADLSFNDFAIPVFCVVNHNIYHIASGIPNIDDIDDLYNILDKEIPFDGNGFYSLKGDTGIVRKCGPQEYLHFEYWYNGVFYFEGKKYGLKDFYSPSFIAAKERGEFLGTANGLKLYEAVGNDSEILVDVSPVFRFGGSECLLHAVYLH